MNGSIVLKLLIIFEWMISKTKQKERKEKENLTFIRFCRSSRPQGENKIKRNDIQILVRELKKNLRNMNVTVIPVVVCEHGTVSKRLERGLEEFEIKGRIDWIYGFSYFIKSILHSIIWSVWWIYLTAHQLLMGLWSLCGVVVKLLDYFLHVSEFELQ